MIYITQLIFVKDGQESVFHAFEELAIPLIAHYNGKLMYRIRPAADSYVIAEGEKPYEIHLVSFETETDFQNFMKNETRLQFLHLKEESVQSMFLMRGTAL